VIFRNLLLLAALLVALAAMPGCSGFLSTPRGTIQGGNPLVTASDGASTTLVVLTCPTNPGQVTALQETINMLSAHGLMVAADSGGSARLTINACPNGIPSADQIRALGENQRARRP
jgi:hypothetical protein